MYRSSFLVIGSCHWDGWEGLIDMKDFTKRPEFADMPKGHQVTWMNYMNIPRIPMKLTESNVDKFNKQIQYFKSIKLPKLIRTPSGGIAKRSYGYGWDVRKIGNSAIELTVTTWYSTYRLVLTNNVDDEDEATKLTGCKAFVMMRNEFNKDGIELKDYAVDNGKEIKDKEIEDPMIEASEFLEFNKVYNDVHHLDFHSSYPGGLANKHPEMRKTLERIYEKRKASDDDSQLKLALDASIGYFQSQYCMVDKHRYALSNLARDAINDNNERIRNVTNELLEAGCVPLLYNTDGIWYIGDELNSGRDYGKGIGKWENDHLAIKFRAKSKGSYEYMDEEGYHPVVRGRTKLDESKPRTEWEWGDIYQTGGVKKYALINDQVVEIYDE